MGLDQYAYRVLKRNAVSDIEIKKDCDHEEIGYWRKVWPIQNWMESLYQQKGGTNEFNCEVVRVTRSDLERFKKDLLYSGVLEEDQGVSNSHESYAIKQTKDFLKLAEQALDNGDYVYYDSWW